MNGKCWIFLSKRYSKSSLNRVLLMSVKKDPVSTYCDSNRAICLLLPFHLYSFALLVFCLPYEF